MHAHNYGMFFSVGKPESTVKNFPTSGKNFLDLLIMFSHYNKNRMIRLYSSGTYEPVVA